MFVLLLRMKKRVESVVLPADSATPRPTPIRIGNQSLTQELSMQPARGSRPGAGPVFPMPLPETVSPDMGAYTLESILGRGAWGRHTWALARRMRSR